MTAPYEAVTFDRGESYRAVVYGQLQRPDFNSAGAALAFGESVARGARRAEPTGDAPRRTMHFCPGAELTAIAGGWARIKCPDAPVEHARSLYLRPKVDWRPGDRGRVEYRVGPHSALWHFVKESA